MTGHPFLSSRTLAYLVPSHSHTHIKQNSGVNGNRPPSANGTAISTPSPAGRMSAPATPSAARQRRGSPRRADRSKRRVHPVGTGSPPPRLPRGKASTASAPVTGQTPRFFSISRDITRRRHSFSLREKRACQICPAPRTLYSSFIDPPPVLRQLSIQPNLAALFLYSQEAPPPGQCELHLQVFPPFLRQSRFSPLFLCDSLPDHAPSRRKLLF